MDGYPPGSLDPSVPFLVASGLLDVPSDGQIEERDADTLHTVLSSDVPSLSGKNAEVLHRYLASIDATQPPWTFGDKKQPYRFRVESVGRVIETAIESIKPLLTPLYVVLCPSTSTCYSPGKYREARNRNCATLAALSSQPLIKTLPRWSH